MDPATTQGAAPSGRAVTAATLAPIAPGARTLFLTLLQKVT